MWSQGSEEGSYEAPERGNQPRAGFLEEEVIGQDLKKERELFRGRVWEEGTGAKAGTAPRLKSLAGIGKVTVAGTETVRGAGALSGGQVEGM